MKVIVFTRTDMIGGVAYGPGEIAGWPDHIADRLIAKGFAKLHSDGKVRPAGGKIPGAMDWWSPQQLDEHIAGLEKSGKWKRSEPSPVRDEAVAAAYREKANATQNQVSF